MEETKRVFDSDTTLLVCRKCNRLIDHLEPKTVKFYGRIEAFKGYPNGFSSYHSYCFPQENGQN